MTALRRLCTFDVGGRRFGLDVLRVQEVLKSQEMTPVPLARAGVSGLINLRGQIVLAIDLCHCLELKAAPGRSRSMCVVVRGEDGPVSLLVDTIHDVVDADDARRLPTPEMLPSSIRNLMLGVFTLDDTLLIELDPDRLWETILK